jgi:hypothetical protein
MIGQQTLVRPVRNLDVMFVHMTRALGLDVPDDAFMASMVYRKPVLELLS